MLKSFVAAAAMLLGATSAQAVINTYSGVDDGAAVGGPFTNGSAAQALFLADAAGFGSVVTETFETRAVGYYSPVAIVGGSLSSASPDFGPGFSGVNNTTIGNQNGFNTTAGGERWYGAPDFNSASISFAFTSATNSFGIWMTGAQASFNSVVTITQLDGSTQSFNAALTANGGAAFFGLTDTAGFTGVDFTWQSSSDAWGIDDVSYNAGVVPEPASWAMMIAGFGLAGAAMRRRDRALRLA